MGLKATAQRVDDLDDDLEPRALPEIDAAIDEADAQIAAGAPCISAEESLERLRSVLFG